MLLLLFLVKYIHSAINSTKRPVFLFSSFSFFPCFVHLQRSLCVVDLHYRMPHCEDNKRIGENRGEYDKRGWQRDEDKLCDRSTFKSIERRVLYKKRRNNENINHCAYLTRQHTIQRDIRTHTLKHHKRMRNTCDYIDICNK